MAEVIATQPHTQLRMVWGSSTEGLAESHSKCAPQCWCFLLKEARRCFLVKEAHWRRAGCSPGFGSFGPWRMYFKWKLGHRSWDALQAKGGLAAGMVQGPTGRDRRGSYACYGFSDYRAGILRAARAFQQCGAWGMHLEQLMLVDMAEDCHS